MKLTKTCARFLRKHGGTILAVAASVGVVATAIETGRATTKAQHILEVDKELTKFNENEFGVTEEPPTKKQIVLMCWKAYVPAAILVSGFTTDWPALLVGVNIGGLGTLIASMASLISYKQLAVAYPELKTYYFRLFTGLYCAFLAALLLLAAAIA